MAETSISNFNLLNFAEGLGNVAAANQFYAVVELPDALQALFDDTDTFRKKISFSIKATNVPESNIGVVDVNFRGSAKLHLPGDRDTSGTWNITIRADVNGVVHDIFERWNDAIVGNVEHDTIGDYDLDIMSLMGVGEVNQLSRNGKILKTWNFDLVWPQIVGEISYDWDSENTVIEFPVTLVYHHKESESTRNNVLSSV